MDELFKLSNELLARDFNRITSEDFKKADYKYEILKEEIEDFQNNLSDEYDVMVALASFGQNITMQVTEIGYHNPDVLFFYGYINNNKTQLIQHVSQLNFLLLANKKEDTSKKPNRIGFFEE
ncbi:MAG: DUF6173 family protein [Acutalibacteraceae bacterium]|nr:DUF6173 family protein [Acutalibacteraceae bacterium]